MTTSLGFHSMSEQRRIVAQLSTRTDEQLYAMVSAANPALWEAARQILAERKYASGNAPVPPINTKVRKP